MAPKFEERADNSFTRMHLGCGKAYQEGWVNVDFADVKADKYHDLNKFPYPFKDNSFDFIFTSHTLEHLRDPFRTMLELYRILKPGAMVEIRVPHFSHYSALASWNHLRCFALSTFGTFTDDSIYAPEFNFYSDKPLFKMVRRSLAYQRTDDGFKRKVPKNAYYYFAQAVSKLANLHPMLCERIWCHWVGGFNELRVVMKKV